MAETRAGTVTFLFTDQVASTEVKQRLGDDEAEELRRAHFELLRTIVNERGGHEVKSLGDGLMVAFASTVEAVGCASSMQRAVAQHNITMPRARQLHVRIGLDVGEPTRADDDYFGTPVVVAKRLCDRAQGGQILASDLVRRVSGSRGGYVYRDLGPLALKNMTEPVPACEVLWGAEPQAGGAPAVGDVAAAGVVSQALPLWLTSEERTSFVGRDRELRQLKDAWQAIQRGGARMVLIEGEPGIGKTRLAAEFALTVRDDGATLLFGRCEEDPDVPYQPLLEALRAAAAGMSAGVTAALSSDDENIDRARLQAAILQALGSMSRTAPVLFVVDDVQWASKPALAIIKELMRAQHALRLLVLATHRGGERAPALSDMLVALQRERALDRVSLGGMDEAQVATLIEAWGGHPPPAPFTRAILERTDGNPFFIEEVLAHLAETGAIYGEAGRLATALTVEDMAIPAGVKEMIGQRLGRLSDECSRLLVGAAVVGREFDLSVLERMTDVPHDGLLEALEEALAAGIIIEASQEEGRYAFVHALFRETLYEEMTATKRVRLHGQTLRFVQAGTARLAYEVLGREGPHLVATGLTNCPSVRARIVTETRLWERISRHCRVVLYDRRGIGSSDAPEHGYSLRSSVEDLRAVFDAAGIERGVLWGASDGGPLAVAFAVQYPERVAGLILLGTTARLVNTEDFGFGISPPVLDSFRRMDQFDPGRAVSQITSTRRRRLEEANPIGDVMRRVPRAAWAKIIGSIGAADVRPVLSQVRTPTLIIHDPHNTYIPADAARYIHEHIPASTLDITEDAGLPLLSEPLYEKIEQFIDDVAALTTP